MYLDYCITISSLEFLKLSNSCPFLISLYLFYFQLERYNSSASGYCHCNYGYWGPSCQFTCAGGSSNPCYGNGQCNPETGACLCKESAQSQTNCKTCHPGWMGTDCSIAFAQTPVSTNGTFLAKSFQSGHFITLNGAHFSYMRPGEHLLFHTSSISLSVHILQTVSSSHSLAVHTHSVAVKVGSNVVKFVTTGSTTSQVFWNEKLLIGNPNFDIITGVRCVTVSHNHFRIDHTNIKIDIFVRRTSIDVAIRVKRQFCTQSTGLLSRCSNTVNSDFVTRDGTVLYPNTTLSQASIHETFGVSWKVSKSDSLFRFHHHSTIAGSCLRFNDSSIVSDPLFTFAKSDITIELKFKANRLHSGCGVLWSYRSNDSISLLVCENHLSIHFEGTVHHLKSLAIATDVWYHLTVVWSRQTTILQVFLITDKYSRDQMIKLGQTKNFPFQPGGTIRIGQWNPVLHRHISVELSWRFFGEIDDVRIWKRRLTIAEMQRMAFVYVPIGSSGLVNHWLFNEGHGSVVVDIVSGIKMRMIIKPWTNPKWILSSVFVTYPSLRIYNIYKIIGKSQNSRYQSFCQKVVLSTEFNNTCSNLGSSVLTIFYKQCIFNAAAYVSVDTTMEVVLALASYCRRVFQVTIEPEQKLCNMFPTRRFPNWVGDHCNIPCISGHLSTNRQLCSCLDGFWGPSCKNLCPFAHNRPCGFGTCSSNTGFCSCDTNFIQGSDCSKCSPGWHGTDCISARVNSSIISSIAVCSIYSYSHLIMFDGQSLNLDEAGEFILTKSFEMSAYVRSVPCGSKGQTCVTGLWVSTKRHGNITIHAPTSRNSPLTIWHNSKNIKFDIIYNVSSTVSIVWDSKDSLLLNISKQQVKIQNSGEFLELTLSSEKSNCNSLAHGLCGNCDGNPNNDFRISETKVIKYENISAVNIKAHLLSCSIGHFKSTGFVYVIGSWQEPRFTGNGGHCLHFNNSGCESSTIHEAFKGEHVTIELKFRAASTVGVLLGLHSKSRFLLYLNGTIWIAVDGQYHDTQIIVSVQIWSHISLVYSRTHKRLVIYHIPGGSLTSVSVVSIILSKNVFLPGDTLRFGSTVGTVSPPFLGEIDEVRVWKKTFGIFGIIQNSRLEIDASFTGIHHHWSFSRGSKFIATDTIGSNEIRLPHTGISWWLSGLHLQVKKSVAVSVEIKFSDPEWIKAAKICDGYFAQNRLVNACSSLGDSVRKFYVETCKTDIYKSSDDSMYISSLAAYSELCLKLIDPVESPLLDLCQKKGTKHYRRLCLKCKFGELNENDECQCLPGYWGFDCSQVCPGGVNNICNGVGQCNVTSGHCHCLPTWNDDDNCQTCKDGWSGENCNIGYPIAKNGSFLAERSYCSIFGSSHVLTFQGAKYTFTQVGEFYLVRGKNTYNEKELIVQVRTADCFYGSTCIVSMALKYGEDVIVIRTTYDKAGADLVWVNGERQLEMNVVEKETFAFEKLSKQKYIIEEARHKFRVVIRTYSAYLTLAIETSRFFCADILNVCGQCANSLQNVVTESKDWLVPSTSSLFGVISQDHEHLESRNSTGAGRCLFFKETQITSMIVGTVIDSNTDLTLEFYVNPSTDGIFFTYSQKSVFSMFTKTDILMIQVGPRIISTKLVVKTSVWQRVVISWNKRSSNLDVYISTGKDSTETASIYLSSVGSAFEPSGILTLGGWFRPFNENISIPTQAKFTGQIDQFVIWHRSFIYDEIRNFWGSQIDPTAADLAALWKFDEGKGLVSVDIIRGIAFYLNNPDWQQVRTKWVISSAPLDLPVRISYRTFRSLSFQFQAQVRCKTMIYNKHLTGPCSMIDQSVFNFYYISCVSDVAGAGRLDPIMALTVSLADFCQLEQNLLFWPAQNLCNDFPSQQFPLWYGPKCKKACHFGDIVKNNCLCQRGYWGQTCIRPCEGGTGNTCSQRGYCNQFTGNCVCLANWGGHLCDSCAKGWKGPNCSIAEQPLPSDSHQACSVIPGAFFTALDGTSFALSANNGLYRFYQDEKLEIQIYQMPCQKMSSCIASVALKSAETSLILTSRKVLINGTESFIMNRTSISSYHIIRRIDQLTYEVIGVGGILIKIYQENSSLNIELAKSRCEQQTAGICGSCRVPKTNNCEDNDTLCLAKTLGLAELLQTVNVSSSFLQEYWKMWQITTNESLFSSVPGITSPEPDSGFAISINGSWIVSEPFQRVLLSSDYISIEFTLKVLSLGGTVLSFAHNHTFAISIEEGQFSIHFNNSITKTGISVGIDAWTHIGLVYNKLNGTLIFHYINEKEVIIYRKFVIGPGCFPVGGTLAIGIWQLSVKNDGNKPQGIFTGVIDKIQVWNKYLTTADIISHWTIVFIKRVNFLVLCWNFDEGFGQTAQDLVVGHVLKIQGSGVFWILSDFKSSIIRVQVNEPFEINTISEASRTCTKLLLLGDIPNICARLEITNFFYYAACVSNVVRSKNKDIALNSVIIFSSICQSVLRLGDSPSRNLCNAFPSKHFPLVTGSNCDQKCVFGTAHSREKTCICWPGYWGDQCDKECVGGSRNVCSGHGKCSAVTGNCFCKRNWGGEKCDSCANGWTGKDCSLLESTIPDDSPLVCTSLRNGMVMNFAGLGVTVNRPGTYNLIMRRNFSIQVFILKLSIIVLADFVSFTLL